MGSSRSPAAWCPGPRTPRSFSVDFHVSTPCLPALCVSPHRSCCFLPPPSCFSGQLCHWLSHTTKQPHCRLQPLASSRGLPTGRCQRLSSLSCPPLRHTPPGYVSLLCFMPQTLSFPEISCTLRDTQTQSFVHTLSCTDTHVDTQTQLHTHRYTDTQRYTRRYTQARKQTHTHIYLTLTKHLTHMETHSCSHTQMHRHKDTSNRHTHKNTEMATRTPWVPLTSSHSVLAGSAACTRQDVSRDPALLEVPGGEGPCLVHLVPSLAPCTTKNLTTECLTECSGARPWQGMARTSPLNFMPPASKYQNP